MPLSDKAKAHKREYDTSKFKTVSVALPRDTAESFREHCRANGTTAHALLKKYIEECISKNH